MLHEHADARHLAVLRIAIFAIWLVEISPWSWQPLLELPPEAFAPIGLSRLLPDALWEFLLSATGLAVARVALTSVLVLGLVGAPGYRWTALLAALGVTLHESLWQGFAHRVNHAQLAALYGMWLVTFFPAADAYALRRWRPAAPRLEHRLGVTIVASGLLFAYTAIGVYRLVHASPNVFFDASIQYAVASNTFRPRAFAFGFGSWLLEHQLTVLALKVGYLFTTVLEAASFLVLFHRGFRLTWVTGIIVFHILSLPSMNLLFWHNMVLILVLFSGLGDWLVTRLDRIGRWYYARPRNPGRRIGTRVSASRDLSAS